MPDEVAGLQKLPTAPPPGAAGGGDDNEAVGEDWFAGGDSAGNGGGGEAGNGEPAAKRPNVQYGATGLKQASTKYRVKTVFIIMVGTWGLGLGLG